MVCSETAWVLWFPPCSSEIHSPVIPRSAPSVPTQSDHNQPLDASISHLPILQAPSQRRCCLLLCLLFPQPLEARPHILPTAAWNYPRAPAGPVTSSSRSLCNSSSSLLPNSPPPLLTTSPPARHSALLVHKTLLPDPPRIFPFFHLQGHIPISSPNTTLSLGDRHPEELVAKQELH